VYVKAVPTVPVAVGGLVIVGVGAFPTVSVTAAVPVPPGLVALTVNVYVPGVVGVPEIVFPEMVKNAGNPLAP
jgi:hypothetical protein